jgi:TusA-related sulfurtransferase
MHGSEKRVICYPLVDSLEMKSTKVMRFCLSLRRKTNYFELPMPLSISLQSMGNPVNDLNMPLIVKVGMYFKRKWRMHIMEQFKIDDSIDITDVVCPITFVKAKVAMDELEEGQIISIRMNDGEPVQNVPRSIKDEGHQILKLINNNDGTFNLIVKKVGD